MLVSPYLLENDCATATLSALHKLPSTKARAIETDLQADWIRKNNTDSLMRYKYVYDDTVPMYAKYDWLPPAMVCPDFEEATSKGRRKFKGSVKHQIFVYMDNYHARMGKPDDAKTLRALCRSGRERLVKERGFKNNTVSQAITDWKRRLSYE